MPVPMYGQKARDAAARLTSAPVLVEIEGRVGLAPEALFAYVTDANKLSEWLPIPIKSSTDDSKAEVPSGVGSVRVIRTGPMPPTLERVVAYEPNSVYAYSANDASLMGMYHDHLSVIGIEPHPAGGSMLTYLAYAQPGKSWIGRYVGLRMIRHVLAGGLANLQRKFPVRG